MSIRQVSLLAGVLLYPLLLHLALPQGVVLDTLRYLPPFVLNAVVAAFFLQSLRFGREPLITRFARIARGHLEPAIHVYTRRLTWVWGMFCTGLALISLLLAWWAPRMWQLMFANGLNYLMMLLLFAGENLYRRWRFRHVAHVSPLRMWQLVRAEMMRPKAGLDG